MEPLTTEEEQNQLTARPIGAQPDRSDTNRLAWEAQGGVVRGLGPISDVANFGGAVYDSFGSGGNIAVDMSQYLYRKFTNGPRDENWKPEEFLAGAAKNVPFDQHWRFMGTRNAAEAGALLEDYNWRVDAQRRTAMKGGFTEFTAGAISGLIDVDAPLMLISGGLSAGAKLGINATKVGRMMAGTSMGAIMGAGLGSMSYQFNPVGQADEIMLSAAFGAGLGFVGGSFARRPIDATQEVRRNLAEEVGGGLYLGRPDFTPVAPEAGQAPFAQSSPVQPVSVTDAAIPQADAPRRPVARAVEQEAPPQDALDAGFDPASFSGNDSSMGARARPTTTFDGAGVSTITNTDHLQRIADATNYERQNSQLFDAYDNPEDGYNKINAAAMHAGDNLARVAAKLGVGTDFNRLMGSNNPVWRMMAGTLLEDASGRFRTNQTASVLQRGYVERFGKDLAGFDDAVRAYRDQELGINGWDAMFNPQYKNWERDLFRRVQVELDNRRYGRPSDPSKYVQDVADRHADFFETDVKVGQGTGNELPIESYKGLKTDRNYRQQKWSGRQMTDMVESARKTGGNAAADAQKRNLVDAVWEQYRILYPNIKPDKSEIFAKAVVDRALTSRKGISWDINSLLRGDEGDAIRAALKRNGIDDPEIDSILQTLVSSRDERMSPGHTKQVMSIDMGAVSSKGVRMIDLFDNDLRDQMARRMSATSGQASLARMGITSREEFEKWVAAGNAYDERLGKKQKDPTLNKLEHLDDELDLTKAVDKDFTDALWSMFSGGPVAGGISPTFARLKKVTSLSLMNQIGLTSVAEFGPIAATATWGRFWKHLPAAVRGQFKSKESPLMQEFKHMAFFTPEEVMYNNRFNHESEIAAASGDIGRKIDGMLNRGLEAQAHLSGMLLVRQLQQRVALTSTTARMFEGMKRADAQFSPARLRDIGFDEGMMARFKKYVDDGTVEFDADGNLLKLNMERWDYEDIQGFRNGMTRNTNQLVQKALAGESNVMFHKDGLTSLFWQFKSFPLLAMEKQFNRNNRIADQAALMTYINGLLFAGVAYSARQLINGRDQNLNVEDIARGALSYSNMTGWLPMWVDPLAAAMGVQDWNLSGYSSRGVGSVVSIPAAFGVTERLIQAPGAAVRVAGRQAGWTEYSNDDIRALAATPILGQMFGMSWLLNQGLDEGKIPERVEDRRQAGQLKAAQNRATKAEASQQQAEETTLTALESLAEEMGWVNGKSYVQGQLSEGKTLDDIAKLLQ